MSKYASNDTSLISDPDMVDGLQNEEGTLKKNLGNQYEKMKQMQKNVGRMSGAGVTLIKAGEENAAALKKSKTLMMLEHFVHKRFMKSVEEGLNILKKEMNSVRIVENNYKVNLQSGQIF
jgi:hypothetical protein